ncbi:MAG: hypothetical protein ACTSYY_16780 [Promethearchaeota archaeon]
MSTNVQISNQNMKDFKITKKFFKKIYAYIWCDICKEIISVPIDRNVIEKGLDTGLYVHKNYHTNNLYDPGDPEDKSNNPHTCLIYINSNHDVLGVRTFFGREMSSDEIKRGSRIPIVVKEIPKMVLQLGMMTQEEFNILKLCDGNNSIENVAEIEDISISDIERIIFQLRKKGLINLITRA